MDKFKGANGLFKTRALFLETQSPQSDPAPFTLERQGTNLPCFKDLFLELNDTTGYELAKATLQSWEHWEHLETLPWFKSYVEKWRKELVQKQKSQLYKRLIDTALYSDKSSVTATRTLLEYFKDLEGDLENASGKRLQAYKEKERFEKEEVKNEYDADYNRVMGS